MARCRAITDLPIGVGLGVRTGEQAAQIAGFADAVIVGSAFVSAAEAGGGPARSRELGRRTGRRGAARRAPGATARINAIDVTRGT